MNTLHKTVASILGGLLLCVGLTTLNTRANTGIKVSALPFTNASPGTALMIVDQHGVGRTTNDTWSTTVSNLFQGRELIMVSNLFVTNLTAFNITYVNVTNYVATNVTAINVWATNIYVENLYSSNFYATNITVAGGTTIITNETVNTFNTSVTNDGSNFYYTNTVTTFVNSTISLSNTVFLFNGTNTDLTQLWTNSLGYYEPTTPEFALSVTNVQSYNDLVAKNAFTLNGLAVTGALGEADVVVTNKGFILLSALHTNPADTWLRLDSSPVVGRLLVIQNTGGGFHMLNGDSTWDNATNYLILSGGDWYSTNTGEAMILMSFSTGWTELRRVQSLSSTNVVTQDLWQQTAGGNLQPINQRYAVNIGSNATSGFLLTITNGAVQGGQFGGVAVGNVVSAKGGSIAGGGFRDSTNNTVSADGGSHAGGAFASAGINNTVTAQQGSFAGAQAWGASGSQVSATGGSHASGRMPGASGSEITAADGALAIGVMDSSISSDIQAGQGSLAVGSAKSFTDVHIEAQNGSWAGGFNNADHERIVANAGGFAFGQDVSSPNGYQWTFGRHYTNDLAEGFAIGYYGQTAFGVQTNTGWTGSGNKVFTDNGAFRTISALSSNLWQNIAGTYSPTEAQTSLVATNISSVFSLQTDGSFSTTAIAPELLVAGTNQVNVNLKSMVYLLNTTTNPCYVTFNSGVTNGQHIWLVNVFTNSTYTVPTAPQWDDPSRTVVISGGSWTPTAVGESIELISSPGGWFERNRNNPQGPPPITGTNYWTIFGSSLQPFDTTNFPVSIQVVGTDGRFTVSSPDGITTVRMAADNSGAVGLGSSGLLSLFGAGFNVNLQAGSVYPIGATDLGQPAFLWQNVLQSTNQVWGFYDGGTGDYSRLAISHGGTNSAIFYDSQSSGLAGDPVDHVFTFNGTEAFRILPYRAQINADQNNNPTLFLKQSDPTSSSEGIVAFVGTDSDGSAVLGQVAAFQNGGWGISTPSARAGAVAINAQSANTIVNSATFDGSTTAGDTRLLLWDVTAATLKRVTVGAADSGGTGFRLLRVTN